eukprot:1348054-Amorphochlora_amoeboformis.AAC.2
MALLERKGAAKARGRAQEDRKEREQLRKKEGNNGSRAGLGWVDGYRSANEHRGEVEEGNKEFWVVVEDCIDNAKGWR